MDTETKILRIAQVVEMTGLRKSTVEFYIRKGTFPRPIKLGPKASGWIASEVQFWIRERIAASRGQ